MDGLMMDVPLLVRHIAERAETRLRRPRDRERAPRTASSAPPTPRWSSAPAGWPSALRDLGVGPGDRVATFGWNSRRHLELYFAVPCTGRVLHTLNIRLFEDELRYIVDHAEDEVIFVDASLAVVDADASRASSTWW